MTPRGSAPGVRQSECSRGCPEYVVRCAHYDGDERVVWLVDREREGRQGWGRWQARFGSLDPFLTALFGKRTLVGTGHWTISDDRAEAAAAFACFEAQLLGREQAS